MVNSIQHHSATFYLKNCTNQIARKDTADQSQPPFFVRLVTKGRVTVLPSRVHISALPREGFSLATEDKHELLHHEVRGKANITCSAVLVLLSFVKWAAKSCGYHFVWETQLSPTTFSFFFFFFFFFYKSQRWIQQSWTVAASLSFWRH